MFIDEAFEELGFWILAGGAVIMELLGWMISKKMEGVPAMPIWELVLLLAGTIVAAAFWATRD